MSHPQQKPSENKSGDPGVEIDVDVSQRGPVARSEDSHEDEDPPENRKEPTRRCSKIPHDYHQNRKLSRIHATDAATAITLGRLYHFTPSWLGISVKP